MLELVEVSHFRSPIRSPRLYAVFIRLSSIGADIRGYDVNSVSLTGNIAVKAPSLTFTKMFWVFMSVAVMRVVCGMVKKCCTWRIGAHLQVCFKVSAKWHPEFFIWGGGGVPTDPVAIYK
jgi:hypothetical protein